MVARHCIDCKAKLIKSNHGWRCFPCQEKIMEKNIAVSKFHYDIKDMMKILALSTEEQVCRLSRQNKIPGRVPGIKRHLFVKVLVNKYIKEGQLIPKTPNSAIQEKAFAMCKRKNHSWMQHEKYSGNSYIRNNYTIEGQHTISVGFVHTCYFCGHQEYFYP